MLQFDIIGEENQFTQILLEPQDSVFCDISCLNWTSSDIRITQENSLISSIIGNFHHKLAIATNYSTTERGYISLNQQHGGRILALQQRDIKSNSIVVLKDAFVAASNSVSLENSIIPGTPGYNFDSRLHCWISTLKSDSVVFLQSHGDIMVKSLTSVDTMMFSISSIVAYESTCTLKHESIRHISSSIFGPKCNMIRIIGPGTVYFSTQRHAGNVISNRQGYNAPGNANAFGLVLHLLSYLLIVTLFIKLLVEIDIKLDEIERQEAGRPNEL
jgi:uncharacterized protein (AIM24 family)